MPVKGILKVTPGFGAVQHVEAAVSPQAEAVGAGRGVGARGDGIRELSFRLTWEGTYRVGRSGAADLRNSHGARAM